MGWEELDFSLGLECLHAWNESERERRRGIWAEVNQLSDLPSGERPSSKVLAEMAAEAEEAAPLWMQIVGFNPWTDRSVGPVERRAGIDRLLEVVREMFVAEWGTEGGDGRQKAEGGRQEETDGAGTCFARRRLLPQGEDLGGDGGGAIEGLDLRMGGTPMPRLARFYDPLIEICFYLGIARSRLSALCLERTGLKILEFLDCERVRGFRLRLTSVLRTEVSKWLDELENSGKEFVASDWRRTAVVFLKWMRGTSRGVSRQHLAWELGMPTRARLSKAVFLAEGVTLEELELEIACELLKRAALEEPEPMTCENSVMMGILDEMGAPGAEKSEGGGGIQNWEGDEGISGDEGKKLEGESGAGV